MQRCLQKWEAEGILEFALAHRVNATVEISYAGLPYWLMCTVDRAQFTRPLRSLLEVLELEGNNEFLKRYIR